MTDLETLELVAYRTEERLKKELHFAVATEHAKAFRVFGEEILKAIREAALSSQQPIADKRGEQ